jgi:hypothetical protein
MDIAPVPVSMIPATLIPFTGIPGIEGGSGLAPPLALSCLIHAVAGRTFPAGERGSAAGSLLSSHYPNYTWACVLCRPSLEFPFRFIWVLGWSTWHLALDPSSVLYLQHKLCSYLDALQHCGWEGRGGGGYSGAVGGGEGGGGLSRGVAVAATAGVG